VERRGSAPGAARKKNGRLIDPGINSKTPDKKVGRANSVRPPGKQRKRTGVERAMK